MIIANISLKLEKYANVEDKYKLISVGLIFDPHLIDLNVKNLIEPLEQEFLLTVFLPTILITSLVIAVPFS